MVEQQPDGAGKDNQVRGQAMAGQARLVVFRADHDDGATEFAARGRAGLGMPCWPPCPAGILNHIRMTLGIPYIRFKLIGDRSSSGSGVSALEHSEPDEFPRPGFLPRAARRARSDQP